MALIMFVIGLVLFYTGRFSFGNTRTQGRHVKAAGAVLMMPAIGAFVISLAVGMLFARDVDTLLSWLGILSFMELAGMVAAAFIAYVLIYNPVNAPTLPGILGEIQRQRREQGGEEMPSQPRQPMRRVQVVSVGAPPPAPSATLENFPSVLTVAQAARYLKTTEAEVMELIETGKLAAARINYTYRIARSNLDDLLQERPTV
jgi:excisionase family DNA binding protein